MKKLFKILFALMVISTGSITAYAESIVIYFSRADENYSVGKVAKGNTQVLAEIIAAETGSDMFCIERVSPYPVNYNECTSEAMKEKGKRPALKRTMNQAELDKYDTIYFGTPIWWGDLPMPVYTFIESLKWNGKKVRFFGTHEGSGITGIESGFKSAAKGCVLLGPSLSMFGHDAQKNDEKEKAAVRNWLKK